MASAFTHAVVALAIGDIVPTQTKGWRYWTLGVFCAVIPDADALGYWWGVPYDSLWGHRGITHSFFFAVLLAVVVMRLFYPSIKLNSRTWWSLFCFFMLSTASHSILDACTTGGLGVAFFAPFDTTRYFLPWRVIKVSPIGISSFFSSWGLRVIVSEIIWVWLPCLVLIVIVRKLKGFKD